MPDGHNYTTPFIDLLPPLATFEYAALVHDIAENGQQVPIVVTDDGTVIDGHHRLKACQELGLVPVVRTVEVAHPEAEAIKANMVRRNLSPDQRAVVRRRQQEIAYELAQAGTTQAEIAGVLGVDQTTVSRWVGTNMQTHKGTHPDARVKLPKGAAAEIIERLDAGDSLRQVAADFGVTHKAISKAVNKAKAQADEAAARQADADTLQADAEGDGWKMLHGDFRDRLADLPDGSVDLIVTDPPYPAEFLPLWSDLSEVAARILKPSGVLLAMSGKIHLDQVMQALGKHLQYGWVYALPLPGSHTRILARRVLQAWKPWLAYSNGPWPSGQLEWNIDLLDGSSRHKARYRWEQDPDGCRLLIESLTQPGGVVVDPFTGTGAFGVAARAFDRTFIGVEMDGDRYQSIVERLGGAEWL